MAAWGERTLVELEAEERLAVACERAPTQDPTIAKLRDAFRVRHLCLPATCKTSAACCITQGHAGHLCTWAPPFTQCLRAKAARLKGLEIHA